MEDVVAVPYPVRVETNNRLHMRYRLYAQGFSKTGAPIPIGDAIRSVDDGRCNIDENWVEVDLDRLADADPGRFCNFCFKRA